MHTIKKYDEFLNENLITEKSSLTALGVPSNVMKSIQKDLALPSNTQWEKIDYKYLIDDYLKKGNKSLFLQLSVNAIKIIVCYPSIKGTEFFVDEYKYENVDWSGDYTKRKRLFTTYTKTLNEIRPKSNIYKLVGDFSIDKQSKRKMLKQDEEFEKFNEIFKKEFINKFDYILKKITGANFKDVKNKITDKAKQIAIENDMLIKSLDNPLEGINGLSIMDEFILQFEDAYSEKLDDQVTIHDLVDIFTREKVMTMLMYYIKSGKTMNID